MEGAGITTKYKSISLPEDFQFLAIASRCVLEAQADGWLNVGSEVNGERRAPPLRSGFCLRVESERRQDLQAPF